MCLLLLYMAWPWHMNINENAQPPVDCELGHIVPYFL